MEKFSLQSTLIQSRGGVFEIVLDGELLFSKKRDHRFPEAGEIVRLLGARLGKGG